MAKKQALGRGLGALISQQDYTRKPQPSVDSGEAGPEVEVGTVVGRMAGEIVLLEINQIEANPDQPRKVFEEESLEELAQSIRELGIIQPITVKKIRANKFLIISGERRFRASQLAGLEAIPAYIREANDEQVMQMALVENLQRQDLHAIEMANSLSRLIEEFSLTQDELGKRIGKSRASISNSLRLLRLPANIQTAIIHREITEGHAKALVGIADVEWQQQVFELIAQENLSVRQVEELAKSQHWQEGPVVIPEKKARKAPLTRSESRAKDLLVNQFGKAVKLRAKGNGEGKIELIYKDEQELKMWLESLGI